MLLTVYAVVIHTIKVAFESIQVSRPETAELGQPGVGFAHRLETMESRLWGRAMFAKGSPAMQRAITTALDALAAQ